MPNQQHSNKQKEKFYIQAKTNIYMQKQNKTKQLNKTNKKRQA
jgi:hypothetical protein